MDEALQVGRIFAIRLAQARRGLTQSELAKKIRAMGVSMDRATIAKIEAGAASGRTKGRKVSIEELLILAAALGVSPIHLLVPLDDESPVAVTPEVTRSARSVRAWIRGQIPLREADARTFYSEAPPNEFQEILAVARRHSLELAWVASDAFEERRTEIVEATGELPISGADELVPARYVGDTTIYLSTMPGRRIVRDDEVLVRPADLDRPDFEPLRVEDRRIRELAHDPA